MKKRKIKLTRYEKETEDALMRGEYVDVSPEEFAEMKAALDAYKKNSVLHMRINDWVLKELKAKAKKLGVKYQTFIAEILRKVAQS